MQDFSSGQNKDILSPNKAVRQSGMSKLSVISEAGEK